MEMRNFREFKRIGFQKQLLLTDENIGYAHGMRTIDSWV